MKCMNYSIQIELINKFIHEVHIIDLNYLFIKLAEIRSALIIYKCKICTY